MSFPRYPKYKDSGVEWLGEVPEHWDSRARSRRLFTTTADGTETSDDVLRRWRVRIIP